jgi:hypothetical protein
MSVHEPQMGLDTKTYWLTDRQSQCDFDFDFFKSLLCYDSSSVHREFMRQGIADWPSRVWRRVRITSTLTLRVVKCDGKGTQCRGYNWATLFLGDIRTGTLSSRLGESRIWGSNMWSWVLRDSDLRMNALARTSSNCKRQIHPLIREDVV